MIDEVDARLALENAAGRRGFRNPPGGVGMRRVRGGWLAWADRDDAPEGQRGSVRLEMRDADNTPARDLPWVLEWPAWPADDVADRIDAASDGDRFPPYVQAILEISGWFPGRAIPDQHLDDLAAQFAALPVEWEEGDRGPVVHPAARTALREFGALQLPPSSTSGGLHIAPDPGHVWDPEETDLIANGYEQDFCIVAHHHDIEILMAEEGWCMAAGLNYCRAGDTFENMITFMLTQPVPFPTLDVNADIAQYLAARLPVVGQD